MVNRNLENLLFLLAILLLIGFIFLIFAGGDISKDNACKSIGYSKAVGGGIAEKEYCVKKSGETQEVKFNNCGIFTTCEVYKIE